MITTGRLIVAAALVVTGCLSAGPRASSASSCGYPAVSDGHSNETISELPTFDPADGSQLLTGYGPVEALGEDGVGAHLARSILVDPTNPRRIYFSNIDVLWRSDDGGCNWHKAYQLPHLGAAFATGPTAESSEIDQSVITSKAVYLVVPSLYGYQASLGRFMLLRGTDHNGSMQFAPADSGIAPTLVDPTLLPDPANPDVMYLVGNQGVEGAELSLYVTRNGGTSWTLQNPSAPKSCCAFDPTSPQNMWGTQDPPFRLNVNGKVLYSPPGTFLSSSDGGQSFTGRPLPKNMGDVLPVGAVHLRGGGARVLLRATVQEGATYTGIYLTTDDNGKTFHRLRPPTGYSAPVAFQNGGASYTRLPIVDDGPTPASFLALMSKTGPSGGSTQQGYCLESYAGSRKQPWRQLTHFLDPLPADSSVWGALLAVYRHGRQTTTRLIEHVYTDYQPHDYLVTYRGSY